jgi:integrase/recombinase XerC
MDAPPRPLAPFTSPGLAAPTTALEVVTPPAARLVAAFLAGRSPRTLLAYRRDLEDFARWCGAPSAEASCARLLSGGHGEANAQALAYRAALLARGLAPATVNRRLAAVRSLVALARTLGLVPWTLDVEGVRSEAYRDTRGCGAEGFRKMLATLDGQAGGKAARDRALLRLLYDLGLRRAEVVGLDVEDLDGDGGTLAVLGKGRREKVRLTLPPATRSALAGWLALRGSEPGPLFVALDRAHRGRRLSGTAVYLLVRQLGERAGLAARPHGLRHAAITRALDLTGGDVRAVQRFSRHRDLRTLQRYDDNRQDLAGDVARRLAEDG